MKWAKKLFDFDKRFHSEDEIKSSIESSKNYRGEKPKETQILLIFKTSKQRTWLVATNKRLYCILDDIRITKPYINWSMGKDSLTDNGKVSVEISIHDKSDRTGLVDIGSSHRGWLFTKSLFRDNPIELSIKNLIASKMTNT